jgi:protein phosphatase
MCLDCEVMPWSIKAQALLRTQYATVGAAARAMTHEAVVVLERAAARAADVGPLLDRTRDRAQLAAKYSEAYRRYCWAVTSVDDLRVAPFHLLASEGSVHVDRDHSWHLATLAKLCGLGDSLLVATSHRLVDLTNPASEAEGVRWWETLTAGGGEGMVVKPSEFLTRGRRGIAQPALKCRGPEYLRIIYGMEYTRPENLERLRPRALAAKRSLALRELALGIEGLERFVRNEPLRRVHECVFGVLALESEPVDPRL